MTSTHRPRAAPGKGSEILLATDGSCLRNPGGPTGWAWVADDGRWASGCQPSGTNQVGELWGVLSALRDFPTRPLAIQVDSEYAMKVATVWATSWQRNGWRTRSGDTVANLELVMSIHRQMTVRTEPVRFIKVPGHDPHNRYPLNTAADQRAGAAARHAQTNGDARAFTGTMSIPAAGKRRSTRKSTVPTTCPSCTRPMNLVGECGCT